MNLLICAIGTLKSVELEVLVDISGMNLENKRTKNCCNLFLTLFFVNVNKITKIGNKKNNFGHHFIWP